MRTVLYMFQCFNPRSRKGNDPAVKVDWYGAKFQSTFPQGERRVGKMRYNKVYKVSIHVPARGTTCRSGARSPVATFQSTFPQGERRYRRRSIWDIPIVSIHVPARGTTDSWDEVQYGLGVSIHVPARGTTNFCVHNDNPMAFQSTFPQGERHFLCHLNCLLLIRFNPRSRKGNDENCQSILILLKTFQSTFPQGERQTDSQSLILITMFQSTFPQGERLVLL